MLTDDQDVLKSVENGSSALWFDIDIGWQITHIAGLLGNRLELLVRDDRRSPWLIGRLEPDPRSYRRLGNGRSDPADDRSPGRGEKREVSSGLRGDSDGPRRDRSEEGFRDGVSCRVGRHDDTRLIREIRVSYRLL